MQKKQNTQDQEIELDLKCQQLSLQQGMEIVIEVDRISAFPLNANIAQKYLSTEEHDVLAAVATGNWTSQAAALDQPNVEQTYFEWTEIQVDIHAPYNTLQQCGLSIHSENTIGRSFLQFGLENLGPGVVLVMNAVGS